MKRPLTHRFGAPVVCALLAALSATPAHATFVDANAGLTGVQNGCTAWGDYDGDGDLDLFVAGLTSTSERTARIYQNTGSGFTLTTAMLTTAGVASGAAAAWGDYDNDGDLDLALMGDAGASGRILRIYNNSAGVFADLGAGFEGVSNGDLAWGDWNNDGALDLAVCGNNGTTNVTRVYENQRGVFVDINATLTTVPSGALAWGDYNGDGRLDLIIAGRNTANSTGTSLYMNTGTALSLVASGLPALSAPAVAWGDFDNDGDLDLLLSGTSSTPPANTRVYRNTAGVFADIGVTLQGINPAEAAWGDYDNDGLLDILISGNTGSLPVTILYHNNGNNTFTDAGAGLPGMFSCGIAWGDYDGDGRLDIAIAGPTQAFALIARIYRNTDATPDTPPTPPTGLAIAADATTVTFSWNASTDTGAGGLTYNLWVGTRDATPNIVPPHASPATGKRRIAALGNVGTRRQWTIARSSLRDSTFWSVQAIDQTYAGSAFATGRADVLAVSLPESPPRASLRLAGPNPFVAGARIAYTLPRRATVDLAVHDLAGRRLVRLVAGERPAGSHEARWDGLDSRGAPSPPGLYLVRLTTDDGARSLKLLKLE